MTIKILIYFDKLHTEYITIINLLRKIKNVEILNFICSLNTQISIDGLIQFSGNLLNGIQQTKCDAVVMFSLTNECLDIMNKINSSNNQIDIIIFPLNISIATLEKMSSFQNIILHVCLPLRHLLMIWKTYRKLISEDSFEPLQYIEAKLVSPVLKFKNSVFGTPLDSDINLNNFFQLILVDAIQLLSQRNVSKIQAFSKSMTAETDCNVKNEKYMHDYSVIIAHFKWSDLDKKNSPTSMTMKLNLPPRTALIRINNPVSTDCKIKFKIKVKANTGFYVIDQDHLTIDGKDIEVVDKNDVDDKSDSFDLQESFLSSSLFFNGVERFMKHIEYCRQHGAPRLIDVGNHNEEDCTAAKSSLIELAQFIQLCKVVSAINKAVSSCQTVVVD